MPFFRKSTITSIHSSFCVLQSLEWYTRSYPLTFSWANVYPCITAQVSGINCYSKPLGDVLLMSWLPDALSSQLSDRVWYRIPQSCLFQTHQCGWVTVLQPGLWNPSSSTAPLPHAHPQAHPPSAVLHPQAANGLSPCLSWSICLKSSYPEWDWSGLNWSVPLSQGWENPFFVVSPTGLIPEDPSFWWKHGAE